MSPEVRADAGLGECVSHVVLLDADHVHRDDLHVAENIVDNVMFRGGRLLFAGSQRGSSDCVE